MIANLSAGDIPALSELLYCRCTRKGPTYTYICTHMYRLTCTLGVLQWPVYIYTSDKRQLIKPLLGHSDVSEVTLGVRQAHFL